MKRILNITHNDLDGNAAGVCIKLAHSISGDHVRIRAVDVNSVARTLYDELTSKRRKYDRIILSDCSIKVPKAKCNPKNVEYVRCYDKDLVADMDARDMGYVWLSEWDVVNNYLPGLIRDYVASGGDFVVLDHHPTAVPMKEYYNDCLHEFSILEEKDSDGIPRAGSELAYRYYLAETMGDVPSEELETLEMVMRVCGDYDCFRDPLGFGGKLGIAQELLDDSQEFMNILEKVIWTLVNDDQYQHLRDFEVACYGTDNILAHALMESSSQLEAAITEAKQNLVIHSDKVCEVPLKRYASLVSHSIYTETKGIVVITYADNPGKLSLRGHPSIKIDLGSVAAKYGGGGHRLAAGCKVEPESVNFIISELITNAKSSNCENIR